VPAGIGYDPNQEFRVPVTAPPGQLSLFDAPPPPKQAREQALNTPGFMQLPEQASQANGGGFQMPGTAAPPPGAQVPGAASSRAVGGGLQAQQQGQPQAPPVLGTSQQPPGVVARGQALAPQFLSSTVSPPEVQLPPGAPQHLQAQLADLTRMRAQEEAGRRQLPQSEAHLAQLLAGGVLNPAQAQAMLTQMRAQQAQFAQQQSRQALQRQLPQYQVPQQAQLRQRQAQQRRQIRRQQQQQEILRRMQFGRRGGVPRVLQGGRGRRPTSLSRRGRFGGSRGRMQPVRPAATMGGPRREQFLRNRQSETQRQRQQVLAARSLSRNRGRGIVRRGAGRRR
jgi:hypothetical protein